jgi:hypothetical protein
LQQLLLLICCIQIWLPLSFVLLLRVRAVYFLLLLALVL